MGRRGRAGADGKGGIEQVLMGRGVEQVLMVRGG